MPPNARIRPTRDLNAPPPTWRERRAALRHVPALLKLVWRTHRGYAAAMVALRVLRAFVPVIALWVGKLIIDAVVAAQRGQGDGGRLVRLVLLELAVVVIGEVLARASVLAESLLGDLFSNRLSVQLMEHAATLDLAQFEDPTFYDQLERARRQTVGRIGLLTQITSMAQDTLTLVTLAAALVAYNPWLILLLLAAILPSVYGETHFAALGYSLLFSWTPQRRQLDYLRFVGASDKTAKEVQMFGLAGWLTEQYRVLSDQFYEENKKLSLRKGLIGALLSILGTLGYYAAYGLILRSAFAGLIAIGTLTFLAASFGRSRDLMQRLLLGATDVYEQALYLKDLFGFFEVQPTITSKAGARPVPNPIREGFVFEDVGFRYPESERWAVRHVNFALRRGERVALVGENGAGKTTITKLLARLYDPTEGRVLLDGVDLREYDLASLRDAIGVIFQDFVRYDMAFDENVGVGQIAATRDYLESARGSTDAMVGGDAIPALISDAAEQSLASSLLPRLPAGYRQMLGRRFEGGVDLSGGEWQ